MAFSDEHSRDKLVKSICKKFGDGAVIAGQDPVIKCDVIPTGAYSLDNALGVGGIPKGRIIEIFGPESSGKTTLTLNIIANLQKSGGSAAFIDAEHALDINWAKNIGVNIDDILISQPDTGEQALEIVEMMSQSGEIDLVVVDSVAALIPKVELEGEMEDHNVGAQARMMSKAMRKIKGSLNKSSTTVIFINQIREKIGVMFGSPNTTPGGRALKFYASVRLDIKRIGSVKEDGNAVANKTRVKIVKNKVAPPFKEAEFDIAFGDYGVHGIDTVGSLLHLAEDLEIIEKNGSWYSFDGDNLAQGRLSSIEYIRENQDVRDKIEHKLNQALGVADIEEPVEDEENEENGDGFENEESKSETKQKT